MSRTYLRQKGRRTHSVVQGTVLGIVAVVVVAAAAAGIGFQYGQTNALSESLSLRFVTALGAIFEEDHKMLEAADREFQA